MANFCAHCGHELREDDTFCSECGTKGRPTGANFCAHCGHELQEGETFCSECGTLVGATALPAPPDQVE